MRCLPKGVLLVTFLLATRDFKSSGNLRQKFISTPDKPTRVFIGDNVSLAWSFYHPSHFKLYEVVLGIPRSPTGALAKKLVAVNASGFAQVRTGWESRLQWAGNLTSFLAVFVLHNVQPSDTLFGMHVEYDLHTPLIDSVRLQVEKKPIANLPRITFVTTPPLLRMGQKVSLNCTASSLSPVDVTWYRGSKVLASGISVVVVTMTNITGHDWGEFLCVANNSVGEDRKSVILKVLPESPTILNTNQTVARVNWTLRWSEVYSEGQLLKLYTVWHKVVHLTKDSATIEEQWLRVNITGFMYHKELTADRSYTFAVTAWNRWGESSLETDKMFSILTDFPDTTTKEKDKQTTPFYTVSSEPYSTAKVSNSSNRRRHFMGITRLIVYIILPIVLCFCVLLLVVVGLRRKYYGRKKNNGRHQDLKGISSHSFTSQDTLTSDHEEAQETPDERRSTIMAETPLSMSESHLNSEETTSSLRSIPEDCNRPKTGICFVLSTFRPEMNTMTPGSTSQEEPSSSGPFAPHRGSEGMEQNLDIHEAIIKASSSKEKNKITKETNETSGTAGMVYEGAVHQRSQETLNSQALDAFRQKINGSVTDTHSEGYLQPVENNNLQHVVINTESSRLCNGKTQSLTQSRPTPKPRFKVLSKRETDDKFGQRKQATFAETLMNLEVTDMFKSNPLCDTEAAQHCARVKPLGQSNHLIPQARTRHGQHGYQNDRLTPTPYQNTLRPAGSGESPYTRVLSNTNWEVSNDHLSLFERIGGGSFGQVWKGAALDVAGAKGWSIVAVKMLKENSSKSDLRDLLSELDLLKKLKPHPNVIQLLGCLTKDVIRYKRGREFRPPLVILEFVPHGDLLGYLKKSRGETDDYYNLKSTEIPRKIPTQQLYRFASDIARGMEFISAHQLIHRDLAARNVLVGEGLRCKITDFGMARDLGKTEIYVRRSNGLMPVKWMAVESLTSQVFTTESDVWSYGIVLYEIFTFGGRPYDGMTGEEVFNYVSSGRRLPRTSAMSSELYNLMLECWQEEPCRRPTFSSLTGLTETLARNDY